MKGVNKIDVLFDRLSSTFSGIKGLNLVLEDEDAKHFLFDVLIARIADIQYFENLYSNTVLVAVDKSISDSLLDFNKSKYKKELSSIEFISQVKLAKPEFIRQAYVIAFHKFEVFAKTLKELMEKYWNRGMEDKSISYNQYCKNIIGVNILDEWYKFERLHVIQFICNSTKHHDGYPVSKYAKPTEFINNSEDEKIVRTTKQFKDDMKYLTELTIRYYELFNTVFLHQSQCDILKEHINFNTEYATEINNGIAEALDVAPLHTNVENFEKRIAELKKELLYETYW